MFTAGLSIASLVYGPMLGAFLLGVLTTRANQPGVMAGIGVSLGVHAARQGLHAAGVDVVRAGRHRHLRHRRLHGEPRGSGWRAAGGADRPWQQTLKLFLVPGSVQFLAIGLALGVGLLYGGPRLQRWGRRWLTGLLPFYLFLCTPVGADVVVGAARVADTPPVERRGAGRRASTPSSRSRRGSWVYKARGFEVDEMGKFTSHNALETARVYRLMGSPTVLVAGGMVVDGDAAVRPSRR